MRNAGAEGPARSARAPFACPPASFLHLVRLMGLLTNLLLFPVTAPAAGIRWSLDKVMAVAREELTDDTAVKQELMELQMLLELGDIDDEEYARREAGLMARLREVRRWREEFGMSTPGGPVRIARDTESPPYQSPTSE